MKGFPNFHEDSCETPTGNSGQKNTPTTGISSAVDGGYPLCPQ